MARWRPDDASGMIPARMNARWITVISGIAVGAICAALVAIPAVRVLEQQYGLQGLFDLRGPIEPQVTQRSCS